MNARLIEKRESFNSSKFPELTRVQSPDKGERDALQTKDKAKRKKERVVK